MTSKLIGINIAYVLFMTVAAFVALLAALAFGVLWKADGVRHSFSLFGKYARVMTLYRNFLCEKTRSEIVKF